MKRNSGVSMIELVVVVIIIMMIAAFAISSGSETLNEADVTDVYVEISAIKDVANSIILTKDMDDSFVLQQGKHYDIPFVAASGVTYGTNVTSHTEDWYIILGIEKEGYNTSVVKDTYGLESVKRSYIINFETGEVELYEPLTIENTSVRTYDEIRRVAEN